MPFTHHFKPTHKEIKTYYEELAAYAAQEVALEGATSSAFQNQLAATCKKADWHLVPQLSTRLKGKQVRPDGNPSRLQKQAGKYYCARILHFGARQLQSKRRLGCS